jgi:hypothetical protein
LGAGAAGAAALPWTCDAAVRAALRAAAFTCVDLVSNRPLDAEDPRLLPSLHQRLASVATPLLDASQLAMRAEPFTSEARTARYVEYAAAREALLPAMLAAATAAWERSLRGDADAFTAVRSLAEAHHGYDTLAAVCEITHDDARMHHYMRALQVCVGVWSLKGVHTGGYSFRPTF